MNESFSILTRIDLMYLCPIWHVIGGLYV